nr:MAG TPA: hypothetical protein [Caudoviricetes sp.]
MIPSQLLVDGVDDDVHEVDHVEVNASDDVTERTPCFDFAPPVAAGRTDGVALVLKFPEYRFDTGFADVAHAMLLVQFVSPSLSHSATKSLATCVVVIICCKTITRLLCVCDAGRR